MGNPVLTIPEVRAGGAERLGLFGGTFDPVHLAHLVAASHARRALGLDRVLMMVANVPWQKTARPLTAAEDRLAMVEAAVAGAEGLEASRMELDRGGETYTADTLEALVAEEPRRELFLIVGSDVAAELGTWRRVDVVRGLATLVVVTRGAGAPPDVGPGWRVDHVRIPALDISSSDMRARVAAGLPLDYLVPEGAVHLIQRRGLYSGGG